MLLTKVDKDGSKTLEPRELRAALASIRGRKDRNAVMGAALLSYIAAAQQATARNPKTLEAMAATKPMGFSFDRDPRVARLQAMVCFYVTKGVQDKIGEKLARKVKEEVGGMIKEEIIGPIIEEAMTELCGEFIAGVVMSII